MANISTDEIQSRVAAIVDKDEDTSNISSADYSLRLKYINMALNEWAETWTWQTLYKEYNALISTSTGNASVALPSDFRKPAGVVKISWNGSTTDDFVENRPQENTFYDEATKRVAYLGNPADGYVLRVYGATLISGASVKVPYYKSVTSLVSPANIAEIPNSDFLVKRTVAYLWEADGDERFPILKSEADRILQNMIEYENTYTEGSANHRVYSVEEKRYNFRIGRD